ncbi:MAG TPA: thrombospondin type 3 repeat-containing protein, partial [Candidatus Hydrogenedentes bacterium]|nr:thrombospondin type 3 repeat-containing protein [Candidatus Hydrogenedentota bacterium]
CALLAHGDGGLPGDVNLDGVVNVLDVQGSINMALGAAPEAAEADADLNASVDVRDVQAIISTALGTGGLVQPVAGMFHPADLPPGAQLLALSLDGRREDALLDPETGAFSLILGVRSAWTLALFAGNGDETRTAASVAFPLVYGYSTALPLPDLAAGGPLDIGVLDVAWGALAGGDLRSLLAGIAPPLDTTDADNDGIPDLLDALLAPLLESPTSLGISFPADLGAAALEQLLADCIGNALPQAIEPDLTGIEIAGVPAFLEPAWLCLEQSLFSWIDSSIIPLPDELIAMYTNLAMDWLRQGIGPWLDQLDRPELEDANGNHVPDFLEPWLCGPAPSSLCVLDQDANGIPDFCEDASGNGLPNLFDPDSHTPDDWDGDGVPNDMDIDADNDGVPNYADANPSDPNVF